VIHTYVQLLNFKVLTATSTEWSYSYCPERNTATLEDVSTLTMLRHH